MAVAIVIPARFASTRYPGKPLVPLAGADGDKKPLIIRSWMAASSVRGVDRVVVATDDQRIADVVQKAGGEALMTPTSCRNGTERCAAVLDQLGDDYDLIINFQGDAPLTPAFIVEKLIDIMKDSPECGIATPAVTTSPTVRFQLFDDQKQGLVGGTTVVRNKKGEALYFSKSVIPHLSKADRADPDLPVFLHIGLYAYRPDTLRQYASRTPSKLELIEGLEQLRFLDEGIAVKVPLIDKPDLELWELNNPVDRDLIEATLMARGIK
ncbi:3-deoxy-manno-octulosonate cytidylyltransferase [Zymomonas sp.]|uniref:3-deoxy-manno-octulosonate cytidylyltransferase n=1 Tax=Zymomonas sp. TaxID=2068624 RepID=UPI0025FDF00E|nr:3-deoxy-manno-octulosonate cytidylyltransferase [Zymomonas sp.]MCA1956600.1 3-deoxy-manno-octulosonate cytidylyltransferase [Zymomonas sp.]